MLIPLLSRQNSSLRGPDGGARQHGLKETLSVQQGVGLLEYAACRAKKRAEFARALPA